MYIIKKRISGRVKSYYYYTEDEAIENKVSYHANPLASFKNKEIRLGDYILTKEGLVVPVTGLNRKQGILSIPTNIIKRMKNEPDISIRNKEGNFSFSVELSNNNKKYSTTIKNIVDIFLNNGFDHIDAVNSVLGEINLKNKNDKRSKEKKRANEYFLREETQEYLRMKAIEHFKEAGIKPSDIIGKMYESLEHAVEENEFSHVKDLGVTLLAASGEFGTDAKPINVNVLNQHNYPQIPQGSETQTKAIGIVAKEDDDLEQEFDEGEFDQEEF